MGRICLSFDNGPHPDGTPRVLASLRRHEIQAHFFVLGKELATDVGADLAVQIRDEGHTLGNHSYTHETPLGIDPRPDAVERELDRTQALLDGLWDGPKTFRPFGGGGVLGPHLLSPAAVAWLARHEATCVLWNAVPEDWLHAEGWVDTALAQVGELDHALVVLHDVVPDAMQHLDRFVGRALDAGHTFTQALPAGCLPIVAGQPQPGLERYVQSPGDASGAQP